MLRLASICNVTNTYPAQLRLHPIADTGHTIYAEQLTGFTDGLGLSLLSGEIQRVLSSSAAQCEVGSMAQKTVEAL